jgi:RNA polymerase sigma factor (TIGR02999 family)
LEVGPGDVTRLLSSLNEGDREAWEPLLDLVYMELRRLARERMAAERADHTLEPTGLVHEAFLRLIADERLRFANRRHFFAIAGRAMERVLIDHARARGAAKRGGGRMRLALDAVSGPGEVGSTGEDGEDTAAWYEAMASALGRLETRDSWKGRRKAEAVRLRYLAGMSLREVADVLQTSVDTVERDLRFSLAWLADQLGGRGNGA